MILSISTALHLLHVLRDRLRDRAQLIGRAELEVLGSGIRPQQVAARNLEGVAGLVDLLVVGERVGHPALEQNHFACSWASV